MKKIIIAFLFILAPLLNAKGLIVKTSENSVNDTISKIETIVKEHKGMGVFTIVDHHAGAKKVGLEMPEEKVILFGNPMLGTKLMHKDPQAGLDLPLRVLVYKDAQGTTKIVYHNPTEWQKGFDLEGCKLINKMVEVLDTITEKASH